MKKILMVAFSCQPGKGSEPGVGWNWAIQAAKTQEVWVLTRSKMEKYITPAIPKELKNTLHFCYAPSSHELRSISIYLEYLAWQHTAYRYGKQLCKEVVFDYVWSITWGNMFLPTYMYKLDVPFIWGPNGAAEEVPMCFWKTFPLKNRMRHVIKHYMGKNIMKLPWVKKPAEKATFIIARTTDTKKLFPNKVQAKILVRLESCVTDKDFMFPDITPSIIKDKNSKNYVYTGRLIAMKNVMVLVDAMIKILEVQPNAKLHIIGSGEYANELVKAIQSNQLQKAVFMYGNVDRSILLKAVSECDGFIFPSLQEGASWSLLEAMYYEKPIVAFDVNGIHDTLDKHCAIMVPIENNSANGTNQEFVEAVLEFVKLSDTQRAKMGMMGKKRLIAQFYAHNTERFIEEIVGK